MYDVKHAIERIKAAGDSGDMEQWHLQITDLSHHDLVKALDLAKQAVASAAQEPAIEQAFMSKWLEFMVQMKHRGLNLTIMIAHDILTGNASGNFKDAAGLYLSEHTGFYQDAVERLALLRLAQRHVSPASQASKILAQKIPEAETLLRAQRGSRALAAVEGRVFSHTLGYISLVA